MGGQQSPATSLTGDFVMSIMELSSAKDLATWQDQKNNDTQYLLNKLIHNNKNQYLSLVKKKQ